MSLPSFELADRLVEDAQHSRTFSEPLPNIQISPPTPTIEAELTEPESEKMNVIIPAVDCYLLSLNDFLPQSPVSYGNDSFITRVGIPEHYGHFVPQKYLQESKERRIVHVKGFPAKWDPPKIQQFFNTWFRSLGRVDTVITIHDLTSRATCRWIIVESKEAAARYGRNLDELKGGIACTKSALGEDGGFVLTGTIANVPDAEWLRGYICVWTQGPIHWDRVPERPVDTMEVSYLDPIWLATTTLLEPTATTGASSYALPTRGATLQEQSNANLTAHMVALSQAHQTQQLATTSSTVSSSSQQVQSPQGSHSTTATDPSGPVHTRKSTPVLPALADQLRDLEITSPGSTSPTKAEGSTPAGQPTVAQTWAKIADAASPNKTNVDLHPAASSTRAPRLVPTGRIPGPSSMRYDTATSESLAEQMRIVFLLNLPNSITLQNVSDAIIEGPICSIRFGTNVDDGTRYAGIIFLYAAHAEQFMQALYNEKQASKPGRFRFIVDVVRGDAFPADDTINAMLEFPHASRRLTLVKKGFFFVVGERVLRRVVEKCVGEEAVQILWLYNGGNATVVFSEVAAAIKFKNEVETKVATGKEPWDGLSVTFSKDPCEVPLRLVTALGTPMENWQ